jgi:hypothetical protein
VAEAAKVIENTQRDVNIALINEFALIFHRLGIDTTEVLEAAGTKWNFLPFRPGLVGGHCIGVDPYYLIQKAQAAGYYPDILLACRRINDAMGQHVAAEVVKLMVQRGHHRRRRAHPAARPDVQGKLPRPAQHARGGTGRRTRGVPRHRRHPRPVGEPREAMQEYGIRLVEEPVAGAYDAVVICVAHDEFKALGIDGLRRLGHARTVYYDIKGVFPKDAVDARPQLPGHRALPLLLEFIGPEMRQYFIESDTRPRRSRASSARSSTSAPRRVPTSAPSARSRTSTASATSGSTIRCAHASSLARFPHGHRRRARQAVFASVFNISAMSFGSLSPNAIRALNTGARRGNFYHDTGEGSISPLPPRERRRPGLGDRLGLLRLPRRRRHFDPRSASRNAREPQVKMIELKLSQGAKPGHGGVLPGRR